MAVNRCDVCLGVSRLIWIVVAFACAAQGQTTRKDSISVSAGLTKEELQISEQFDAKLAAERQAIRADPKNAIDQLQGLMTQVEGHPFLEHHRPGLLVQLGQAYLAVGQPRKAVELYQQRLVMSDDDCKPQSIYPAGCGRARMDLGIAMILAGDGGGLDLLKQAVDDHRRQVKLDGKPEELQHFVHLRHLSEAAIVLAGAYVRLGKPAEARASLEESHNAATKILSVPDVQESLREEAKQFIGIIEKQLEAIKQAGR
jgi:tetratricopeptide (TPR) repeat protein